MPRALILLTNGKYKIEILDEIDDYQRAIDGPIEMLQTKSVLVACYVNEEAHIKQLTPSPWYAFLKDIGAAHLTVRGNILVFGAIDEEYSDTDVPEGVIRLAAQYGAEEV